MTAGDRIRIDCPECAGAITLEIGGKAVSCICGVRFAAYLDAYGSVTVERRAALAGVPGKAS